LFADGRKSASLSDGAGDVANNGVSEMNPMTPDGRYFVVKGQLWRCSNPLLSANARRRLVDELMAARREVKVAKAASDF
jgi:hypothetical protein